MTDKIFNRPEYTAHRQDLRNNATQPEQKLWTALRGKQLGVKFRRQHGIGHYIVDFYSPEAKLVIEVDGDSHYTETAQQQDTQRDAYLQSVGLRVVRFTNQDISHNMAGVFETIKRVVDDR
ncbi:MAG: endonuclease domain-containing protein [Methylococcaceae bacterium]|nr:endonuclease domain-containing protein [Methylococcaceae bacterium]